MGKRNTIQVNVLDELREYPSGILLEEIAAELQTRYPHRIIMARVNGKLEELYKRLSKDATIEFVTTGEKIGEQSYRRTATLMLTKAVSDILGKDEKLVVQFSVHKGYYCEIDGYMPMTQELLDKLQLRMEELRDADLPIVKRTVRTEEAVAAFKAMV